MGQEDSWREQAAQERAKLLAALRGMVDGGPIEDIQHIGATSVPGLPAAPCVDLALAVAPFPLEPEAQAALEALGYHPVPQRLNDQEQRFQHATDHVQLFVVESGSDLWTNYLLVRDYLRHDEAARLHYAAAKQTLTVDDASTKAALFAGLLAQAQPWWIAHHGFGPVEAVVQELAGYDGSWYISSGWALDLFLGRVTRVHHDVDVVVDRDEQLALREHLAGRGWRFVTPLQGRLEPWPAHMRLELPRHQVHAHRSGEFIDFLLTELAGGLWRYRRDPRVIRDLAKAVQQSSQGIPFLAPELVLLFKSKNTGKSERSKDQTDFEQLYPHLSSEAKAWLRWALIATDPAHPWIPLLGSV
jgi:GrpB-like predicted nucleotidyltransferase (UPF0157 family)